MHKICITSLVVLCSLHMPKIIELRQGTQMLQAKTSVGTTLVWPPCICSLCEQLPGANSSSTVTKLRQSYPWPQGTRYLNFVRSRSKVKVGEGSMRSTERPSRFVLFLYLLYMVNKADYKTSKKQLATYELTLCLLALTAEVVFHLGRFVRQQSRYDVTKNTEDE